MERERAKGTMPTYMFLFEKTDEGRKITAEDAQQRRAKGFELNEKYGTEIKALYYGMSEYDAVAIADVPDSETVAKIKLEYEQMGLAHVTVFEVFEPDKWDAILEEALS